MKNQTLNKVLASLLAVLMCMTAAPLGGFVGLQFGFDVNAAAANGRIDLSSTVSYVFDETNGKLEIIGEGAIPDYAENSFGGEISPFNNDARIKEIEIDEGITSIGKYAFYSCTSLTSVSFPFTLKSINDSAFANCSSLDNIVISNGVTTVGANAFANCSSAENINIGCSVTAIGAGAFSGCAVTSWRIPNSVKTIGEKAFFANNKGMSVKYYGTEAQWEKVTVGTGNFGSGSAAYSLSYLGTANKIGDNVYYEVDEVGKVLYVVGSGETYDYSNEDELTPFVGVRGKFTAISIGEGITKVGERLFLACSGALECYLPSTLKTIGDSAFNYCTDLRKINFPNALETIGAKAFYQCYDLDFESVILEFPASLRTIGDSAFRYCQNVGYAIFNDGLETIGAYAFANTALRRAFVNASSITTIGDCAFQYCSLLYAISFGSGLKNLGTNVISPGVSSIELYTNPYFSMDYYSRALFNKDKTVLYIYTPSRGGDSYTIPDTVTTIMPYAFSSCKNLKTINFGSNVTKIEDNAFTGFTLDSVYFYGNETQWNAINMGSNNSTLTSAKRYYVDAGTLGESVNYEFNTTTGELVISSGGWKMNDYTAETSPFAGDLRLKSVTIEGSVLSIGNYLFAGCKNLKTIKFTDAEPNFYIVGDYAFSGTGLESFEIPSTCYKIGDNAFYNCSELKSVALPAQLSEFGKFVFASCPKLETLTIGESSNTHRKYEIVDGVMYDVVENVKYEVTYYLANKTDKEYTIPDTVYKIAEYAFYDAKNLEKVTIPFGMETIPESAFENCTGLKEVTIPWTVTKVCANAFKNNSSLQDVYYSGAKTRWNTITIESGNEALTAATFHSSHVHVATSEAKMVTDGKDGTHQYKCSCGEYCEPSAHVWDSGSATTLPTHLEFGVRTFTCICGATYTAPEPKSESHEYEFVTVYPTCTEQGYTVATCPCGDTYTSNFVEPNGHHYEKGVCTECGAGKEGETCDCMCHNESGFIQFFYKIARFFWKIFKINQTCSCGVVHY